jgi:DNA-binding transcriptional ArsR family regulator
VAISTVAQVRTQSNAIGSARLLLLIIASHVSPTSGYAWPSVPTLAKETKLSIRHVYRLIRRLEEMGEIEVTRRSGRVNLYRIKLSTAQPYQLPTPDSILSPTRDTIPTAKSEGKGDIALTRLETWLTPGSRIWKMLVDG